MLILIFYYIFAASLVLFYGAGINRLLPTKKTYLYIAKAISKNLLVTETTASLSYLVIKFILFPLNLYELYSFVAVIIFLPVAFGISIVMSADSNDITEDFVVPLLITFVALNEGVNILEILIIVLSCVASFYIFVLTVWAFHKRFSLYSSNTGIKSYCLILFSIAVVIVCLCSVNASWLAIGLND